jgi:Fe2+ or Zn2+ uptake regulation protein
MRKISPCFVCETDAHGFYDAAITLLRATGHRITKPREILLEVLSNLEEPKTPTDLFELVTTHQCVGRHTSKSDRATCPETINTAVVTSGATNIRQDTPDNISPDNISIDKVTVYRMLQAFESLGIVHQTRQNEYFKCSLALTNAASSDHTSHEKEHYHIVMKCQRCNATSIARPPKALIESLKKFLRGAAFTLTTNVIEVSGTCASCHPEP